MRKEDMALAPRARQKVCEASTVMTRPLTTATSIDCRQQNSHSALTCTQVAPCTLGLQEEMAVVLSFLYDSPVKSL